MSNRTALEIHFILTEHNLVVKKIMTKISEFFGIEIVFNYRGEHNPPHFHARQAGREGVFTISPLGYLHGDLTPRAVALVIEWAAQHIAELDTCWRLAREMQPIPKISPLE
jgi:hypothetical protein